MSRYIDADELMEIFKILKWDASYSIVHGVPTADVVEVKHGEWKPKTPLSKSYRFVCSVCGGTAYYCSGSCASVRNNVKNVCRYNYCPNCGARMDRREEEQ